MSIATLGSYFQSDSINDKLFIRKAVQDRRVRIAHATAPGQTPSDDLLRRRRTPELPLLSWPEEQAGTPRNASAAGAAPHRSASEPRLGSRAGVASAASTAASSHASRWSRRSSQSVRSKIEEAVEREVASSALGGYLKFLRDKEQRQRTRNLERPLHLRVGTNPIDNGCPRVMETEAQGTLSTVVKYAVDPKWSTDLKKINDRVGQRLEYEQRLSGTRCMIPELPHMQPKRYVSNPPTPYFVPGVRGG
mmetsp:Transcript_38972/g.121382  ORF Transcript_38972/g.121382 Transcript_38972/m.121382 type:complete len:249 (-) Transcript_38972:48-794(-)